MTSRSGSARHFTRRAGSRTEVVWTDDEGITFAKFDPTPEGIDLASASSLDVATTCARIPWSRVRKVQKSESRAIHVEDGSGGEHFATFAVDDIWAEVRARARGLQERKAAAPSVGKGWWLKLSAVVGALGATVSAGVFWLSGQERLWDSPTGRVRGGAVGIMWLLRAVAWIGPWPWVAVTVLAVGFAVSGALRDGKRLPQDDVLVRE